MAGKPELNSGFGEYRGAPHELIMTRSASSLRPPPVSALLREILGIETRLPNLHRLSLVKRNWHSVPSTIFRRNRTPAECLRPWIVRDIGIFKAVPDWVSGG